MKYKTTDKHPLFRTGTIIEFDENIKSFTVMGIFDIKKGWIVSWLNSGLIIEV